MMTILALAVPFNAIHFMVGFLVLICVLAILIIGIRWLLGLTGLAVPQPLLVIAGIILFLVMFFMLLNYAGLYSF